MPQILVFGDSEAHGSCDPEGGWVAHLNRYCETKTLQQPNSYFPVYNLGISGDTSEYILGRFERETRARILEEKETIFIFQDGGNDAMYLNADQRNQVAPEQFRSNVSKLLTVAKGISKKIVWLGLEPVDEKRLDPISWYPAGSYLTKYNSQYNEMLRTECQKAGVAFLDLVAALPPDFPQRYTVDGVHPSTAGHKMIWEIVKKFLVGKGWI